MIVAFTSPPDDALIVVEFETPDGYDNFWVTGNSFCIPRKGDRVWLPVHEEPFTVDEVVHQFTAEGKQRVDVYLEERKEDA